MFNRQPTPDEAAAEAGAKRIGDLLAALETCDAREFRLTPLSLAAMGRTRAVVLVRVGDHASHLAPGEARLVARCLNWETPHRAARLLACLFDTAAQDAEDMSDRRGLTAGGARLVEVGAA